MARKHSRSSRGAQKRRKKATLAARADRHLLYERAVQDPSGDIDFFERVFRKLRGRRPMSMREDFCGTAHLSVAWAQSHKNRTAIGVDLDRSTLAWGRKHKLAPAGPDVEKRVELVRANVLDGVGAKAEIVCALNFSYSVFKTRDELRSYLEVARQQLTKDGVFFLDLYGGTDSIVEDETETDLGEFVYVWDQADYDPLTSETLCYIHFTFPDGSAMMRAFTYDWRLWTIQELRELLTEAGFSKVHVYWEKTDEDGEGIGVFYEPKRPVYNQACWWTYIAAER